MTLSTTDTNQQFEGNGVITVFTWTYKTLAITDMEVYLDGVIQLTGFTLQLNGDQDTSPGGTCTFSVAPGNLVNVNFVRSVEQTQLIDYQPFDAFPSETHETALDRLTMQTQELDELLNRSTVPPPDAEPGDSFVDGDLEVTGSGKFGGNIEVTEAAPTEDFHLTRKDYVDDGDAAIVAGVPAQSAAVFDSKLDGYFETGLHEEFQGDLNTILINSRYSIGAAFITNGPADFDSDFGFVVTMMFFGASTDATQLIYGMNSVQVYKQWMRHQEGGTWGEWILVIDGRAGSGSTTISDTPPDDPLDGDGWWDSLGLKPYIYYDDGDSAQWVEEVPQANAGTRLVGAPVQVVNFFDGTLNIITGNIPNDDSIPQITEGGEALTINITPTSALNLLKIEATVHGSQASDQVATGALFKNGILDSIATASVYGNPAQTNVPMVITHWIVAGSVAPITFSVRVGTAGGNYEVNGRASTQLLGGSLSTGITITEYQT